MSEDESPNDIFYYASEGNMADMERVVKRHKDWLSHRDIRGRTMIMHAAIGDNLRNLQFLIRKGLSLWDVDNNGDTALHWATQCSSTKVARYILQSAKSPQGSTPFLIGDKDSVTPMHIAAASNNGKILQILLHEFPQPKNGKTGRRRLLN